MPQINATSTALGIAIAGVLATANAAAEPQATPQLPEIVVTARQRAEKIQDMPASVQAFTADDIKAAGIERPQDFIALTPGVAQVQTAEAGDMTFTTRRPGDTAEFEVGAGYGSDNSYKGSVYVGGPLGESVRGSLSAYTRSTDGQWDNDFLGCDDCVAYFEKNGAAAQLPFKVSEIKSGALNFNATLALFDAATFQLRR